MLNFFAASFFLAQLTVTVSASTRGKVVNPHNFKYIINNPKLCTKGGDIGLFVWVHSGPDNFRRRIALRETWANQKNFPASIGRIQVVFFLGAIDKPTTQQRLKYENEVYGDLVQESYMDGYRNLTYKAMSGLKWITKHCVARRMKLILKTDDDMMINTQQLFKHMNHIAGYPSKKISNTIACDVWVNRNVERTAGMKWSVSRREYARSHYPTYCPGLALMMSPDLVSKLWGEALHTQFFWVDDVFFTGLLVENLNVTWMQMGSLFHFGGQTLPQKYLEANSDFTFAHVFKYRTDLFYYLWQSMNHPLSLFSH